MDFSPVAFGREEVEDAVGLLTVHISLLLPSLRSYIRVTVIYHKRITQCLDDANHLLWSQSEPGRAIWSLIVGQPSLIS